MPSRHAPKGSGTANQLSIPKDMRLSSTNLGKNIHIGGQKNSKGVSGIENGRTQAQSSITSYTMGPHGDNASAVKNTASQGSYNTSSQLNAQAPGSRRQRLAGHDARSKRQNTQLVDHYIMSEASPQLAHVARQNPSGRSGANLKSTNQAKVANKKLTSMLEKARGSVQ